MEQFVLKDRLSSLIEAGGLDAWGVEEYAEQLAGWPEEVQQEILRQVAVIWPVSHALCFAFLDQARAGLACLHPSQLPEWVNAILDVYERDGLQQARRFMAEVESTFLCRIRGETGLPLTEAAGRLQLYLRGLSGQPLTLADAPEPSTDGRTIFLPPEVALFKERERNFLVYKLIGSLQWGLLAGGTFRGRLAPDQSLVSALTNRYGRRLPDAPFPADFWGLFPEPRLASQLFSLGETHRIMALLGRELPGLMRDSGPVRDRLHRQRPDLTPLAGRSLLLEALGQWVLAGRTKGRLPAREQNLLAEALSLLVTLSRPGSAVEETLAITAELYRLLEPLPGPAVFEPLLLGGRLRPEAVAAVRRQRREEARQQFIVALAAILPPELAGGQPPAAVEAAPGPPAQLPAEGFAMLPPEGAGAAEMEMADAAPGSPEYLVIGGQEIKIPEPLQPLAAEIRQDLGRIPDRYLSAALARAGKGPIGGPGPAPAEGEAATGHLVYDEWDYRRAGFRKEWCVLLEKELLPVRGTFVATTMDKYRGQLRQLRRQFEMMRLQQRFLKRQQEGDDIDLDAVTEALIDSRAGRSPSEELFVRLARDERSIAAVFLVDMSSSTEGWVNTALKEALVLMCESLEVLGDRYAIYGFSGMRRLRSELYHVKHLEERYDEEVRARIAAITPKDFTRMGPPIRHLTRLLKESDARIRLLITLSDGKPEDYDDYKGEYAIEDTRHALIEAKAAGIHPFCITIDREAHDYIPRMYGEVNSVFIDEVKKLPLRMPEIYRLLTT